MNEDDYKYIYTKRRVYRLPEDAKGIPIEETYPGAQVPAFLKGAVVYDTPRGRIIAHREPERSGEEIGSNARQERPHALGKDAAEARPPAAERPEPPLEIKEKPPGQQDHPMRFFRKDAPAQAPRPIRGKRSKSLPGSFCHAPAKKRDRRSRDGGARGARSC